MFSIFRGRRVSLFLAVQPMNWSFGGQNFLRQPSMLGFDAGGNPSYAFDFIVTAQIGFNDVVSGVLSGNLSAVAHRSADGSMVANFTNVSVDKLGADYTLIFFATLGFPSTGLPICAESAGIQVIVGAAAKLMIMHQPVARMAGDPLLAQPMTHVADLGGNLSFASTFQCICCTAPSIRPVFRNHLVRVYHYVTRLR